MTAYNGTAISYDQIGNPLNDGEWTYTWEHGRELASMSRNGTTWNYEYNASGMRTRRTDGTTPYTYVYTGNNLVYMSVGTNALRIGYDHSGSPIGLRYNGVLYYYVTNLQGDVIAILDGSGNQVVGYTYDAWGNILSTTGSMASTLGAHNPLRYRGYVYDQETGLYYLQSRYYNPEWGRFINADGYASTGQGLLGNNMFAYCLNSPTNNSDSTGQRCIQKKDICGIYASATGILTIPLLGPLAEETVTLLESLSSEVYAFSQTMRQELVEMQKKMPHVHHIVPWGNFSGRSPDIHEKMIEMHEMLNRARINVYSDPINLMLVSSGTHASLHTDTYIRHVHSYIMSTDGSREGIYSALFQLRIEIAAWDQFAVGY